MDAIKTITGRVPGVVVEIYYEPDLEPPEDDIVKIAYSSSRSCLGTENVSRDRLDEIRDGVASGKYVGVPVWAYVHSGTTISTGKKLRGDSKARLRENPFGCPWDSGQSGFAYMTHEDALREWGNKRLSPQQKTKAIIYIDGVVDAFDQYLQGDVYGFRVLDKRSDPEGVQADACWGFYGMDYVVQEAESALEYATKDEPVQFEREV